MKSEVIKDKRMIRGLFFNDADQTSYETTAGCTIKAYGEPGPHCYIPFFSVERDGVIVSRIPATMVEVVYETDRTDFLE